MRHLRGDPPGPAGPDGARLVIDGEGHAPRDHHPHLLVLVAMLGDRCSGANSTRARVTRSPLIDRARTAGPQTSRGGTSSKSTRNGKPGPPRSVRAKSGTTAGGYDGGHGLERVPLRHDLADRSDPRGGLGGARRRGGPGPMVAVGLPARPRDQARRRQRRRQGRQPVDEGLPAVHAALAVHRDRVDAAGRLRSSGGRRLRRDRDLDAPSGPGSRRPRLRVRSASRSPT